jgi:hypothetical protein
MKAHTQSIFIVLAFVGLFLFLALFFSFFFLIILSNINLILKKENSHLVEPALVIVIDEVILGFRGDMCETTFPHECRRSGLNDGTIRK